mmetsp:Transcript_46065/g.144516  ORF Transcript_46065/g.144516 Transcript_46065/m.144516 type:complete len:248 (-) Transcript_46065:695-1438(-)
MLEPEVAKERQHCQGDAGGQEDSLARTAIGLILVCILVERDLRPLGKEKGGCIEVNLIQTQVSSCSTPQVASGWSAPDRIIFASPPASPFCLLKLLTYLLHLSQHSAETGGSCKNAQVNEQTSGQLAEKLIRRPTSPTRTPTQGSSPRRSCRYERQETSTAFSDGSLLRSPQRHPPACSSMHFPTRSRTASSSGHRSSCHTGQQSCWKEVWREERNTQQSPCLEPPSCTCQLAEPQVLRAREHACPH